MCRTKSQPGRSGCQKGWDVRPAHIRPTGVERTFGRDEIIVSKTDAKGRFTYANDVFLRVSGYTEEEVIGEPHNMIRHPEMPKVIFKLLWDTITSGQEIFAYVNNLAADGSYYWVLAHVTPSSPHGRSAGGYHSNRRSPDKGAIRLIDPLYRDLHAAEQRHARPADAMAASGALLDQALAARGQTYEEFVWDVITTGARAA